MKVRFIFVLIACFISTSSVTLAQQGGFNPSALAREALSQPFTGLTTNGTPEKGLFKQEKTGISTLPVISAANDFLASLRPEQKKNIQFPVNDSEWRNWANIHRFPRKGVSLKEMNDVQKEKAYALLRTGLSQKGYKTSRDIMRLNHHLAELVNDFEAYGEHLYWFIIFGNPSLEKPWGWQIEGHHLIINYFVLGDQIVMTPTFMGSEPVHAKSGKYEGTRILEAEQESGLEFMRSLSPDQQRIALIGEKVGRSENLSEMFKDNIKVGYEGLQANLLSDENRKKLLKLIELFINNKRVEHAAIKLEEVQAHFDQTYFAWKGNVEGDAIFYYRIHSPVIFIEFDHQGPIALKGSRNIPTRNHIHTVVRTPNGNDYGKDLLRQHYQSFKNNPEHGHVHQ